MKRQDKHINKFLRDPLPDPEIPADDAWAGMSDMLGPATGQGANGQGQLSRLWKSLGKFKGLLIGVSVAVTSAVVLLIVLNAETKDQKSAKNQSVSSNTSAISSNILDSAQDKIATPPENASLSVAEAPSPIASADPVISKDERVGTESKHLPLAPTSSHGTRTGGTRTGGTRTGDIHTGDTRTLYTRKAGRHMGSTHTTGTRSDITRTNGAGASQVGIARKRDTHISANPGANGRGAFSSPITTRTSSASPTNLLGTAPFTQETVASFSIEKNTNAATAKMSLNSLEPLSGYFESKNNDLSKLVKKPNAANQPQPPVKRRSSIWQGVHFGPEWNINRSIVSPDYMFTSADSVKRPLRLAIPGVFVSKSWNRHGVTFIFNPLHTYFGNKERIAQRLDTLRSTDSLYFVNRHNTNFVKAFGVNFSLQYQYRAFSLISLVGGISYAKYSSALLFREIEHFNGEISMQDHLAAKGQDTLKSYIRPQQWNIRAGLLFHSPDVFNNRLQFAWMTVFPVSNLSLKGFKSVKTPNMQLSLRFLIK